MFLNGFIDLILSTEGQSLNSQTCNVFRKEEEKEEIPFLPQSWIPRCVPRSLMVLGLVKGDADDVDNFLEKETFICDGDLRRSSVLSDRSVLSDSLYCL